MRIQIWDENAGPGEGGASAAAAGLLHPFNPRGGKLWCGDESFFEAKTMLDMIGKETGVDAVLNRGREGIFRLALNAKQEKDYRRSASKNTGWPDGGSKEIPEGFMGGRARQIYA
eukprot:jgi/Bigna1/143275/aug1.77_g17983